MTERTENDMKRALHQVMASIVRRIPDDRFDRAFPPRWRACSARHWTPVEVAVCAALWFAESGARRILDVGSGVGKMCIIGALATDLEFVGVEHRASLVEAAREAAELFSVGDRASFAHASVDGFDASGFDAFYFYNPFGENLHVPSESLDSSVELGHERYMRDVRHAKEMLRDAPVGTRVVTYHGFGGRVPKGYFLDRAERIGTDALRLWVKYHTDTPNDGAKPVVDDDDRSDGACA